MAPAWCWTSPAKGQGCRHPACQCQSCAARLGNEHVPKDVTHATWRAHGTAKPWPALACSHIMPAGSADGHPAGQGLNVLPARLCSCLQDMAPGEDQSHLQCWQSSPRGCSTTGVLPPRQLCSLLRRRYGNWGPMLCLEKSCLESAGTCAGERS